MQTNKSTQLLVLLVALFFALQQVGCSDAPSEELDASLAEGSFGLMSVTYEEQAGQIGAESTGLALNARAQFVHFAAMDAEHVARLLALPLDPSRDLPELKACGTFDLSVDISRDNRAGDDPGHVELLEAGDLSVETAEQVFKLRPRHFPGLLPFITGVVYGEARAAQAQGRAQVRVRGAGGDGVGAFDARLQSPAVPRIATVDDKPLAPDAALLSLSAQRGLRLTIAAGEASTTTYLELRFRRGERELALRCRPNQAGVEFVVPAAQLAQLPKDVRSLELVRMRRKPFVADGLDQAEIRVSAQVSYPISVSR